MLNIFRRVQVVHGPLDAGRAVQGGVSAFRGLIQVGFVQHDLTDHAVIGKLAADRRAVYESSLFASPVLSVV